MASPATRSEARLMLQTMLAERFGLSVHHESRIVPVLALVAGKRGVKLKPAAEGEKTYSKMFMGANATYSATFELDGIAANARSFCDSPVVNLTGIPGIYHVELAWTRDRGGAGRYDPGFWEALERETGLKGEKRKMPREVIVIDHAERVPTAN